MDTKRIVLPPDLVERCWRFGSETVVQGYKDGSKPASAVFSTHGAESDHVLQGRARMAEVAFCVWAKIDPISSLNWTNQPDLDGIDVVYRGLPIDVKQTKITSRFLMFPANKARKLHEKKMEVFVLVKGDECEGFVIQGWMGRQEFCERRSIAGPNFKILEGNWYVDQSLLHSMDALPSREPRDHYCHCGKWGVFGVGVSMMRNTEGAWFCREHRPSQ